VSPSRPFILRPVATSLLMAAILLAGIVAFKQLPVSALPQVDYPTIQVLTKYPGASPDVMASTVTAPLERQFGEMQGLNHMTSTSAGAISVLREVPVFMRLSEGLKSSSISARIVAGVPDRNAPSLQRGAWRLSPTSRTELCGTSNRLKDGPTELPRQSHQPPQR
jgi:hypothetical protein